MSINDDVRIGEMAGCFGVGNRLFCAVLVMVAASGAASSVMAKEASIAAIEKIAVFPILYQGDRADEATIKSFDDTWWQVRDELTDTGRFVVASRALLQKKDVFQPRGQLVTSDAVILGRYVEADAILTMNLKERTLTFSIWQAGDGALVWSRSVELHPSVLIREQLAKVARAMVRDFIGSIPYQAISLQDSFSKQAISNEGGKRRVRISTTAPLAVGDTVQWITLSRVNLEPLFQGGSKVEIIGEGLVSDIQERIVTVDITRLTEAGQIRKGTLVNLPKEQARLAKNSTATNSAEKDMAASSAVISQLASESAIEPEASQAERKQDERGPLATTLSIIGSLAVILLLAF